MLSSTGPLLPLLVYSSSALSEELNVKHSPGGSSRPRVFSEKIKSGDKKTILRTLKREEKKLPVTILWSLRQNPGTTSEQTSGILHPARHHSWLGLVNIDCPTNWKQSLCPQVWAKYTTAGHANAFLFVKKNQKYHNFFYLEPLHPVIQTL